VLRKRPQTAAPPSKADRYLTFEPVETDYIKKREPKDMKDVHENLWKNNIIYGDRKRNDFLDVSKENFSSHFTHSIEGKLINPSTFNIFRDSLSNVREELHARLIANLPEMNLNEVSS
jgi:hypothetical protein